MKNGGRALSLSLGEKRSETDRGGGGYIYRTTETVASNHPRARRSGDEEEDRGVCAGGRRGKGASRGWLARMVGMDRVGGGVRDERGRGGEGGG